MLYFYALKCPEKYVLHGIPSFSPNIFTFFQTFRRHPHTFFHILHPYFHTFFLNYGRKKACRDDAGGVEAACLSG